MGTTDRLLIIGWDGADWEILDDLMSRGLLPNVSDILRSGVKGDLLSTIPSHSWAAWSTFLTGVNPGRHGVFDFVERHPSEPGRRIPVSSTSISAPTFPEMLSEAGHEVRIGNVPVTFPPFPIKGRMIAGVAIPKSAQFVLPPEWAGELEARAPFPINGMEPKQFRDRPEGLVEEARSYIEKRSASFELLLEGDWQVGVCVYVATDRLQHPFGGYLLPSHPDFDRLSKDPLADEIRNLYALLDENIGRLRAAAGPGATTILMSDHGFRPVSRDMSLNDLLMSLGFWSPSKARGTLTSLRRSKLVRKLSRTRVGDRAKRTIRRPSNVRWSETRAYHSATGGGISINLKGREPHGTVDPSDYERVREELTDALLAYQDPRTGERPIAEVRRKEELYHGPHLDRAPDLLALSASQWSFAHDKAWTGEHRLEGIVAAAGGRVSEPGELGRRDIADICATGLAFCGVDPSGVDGKPIVEIAGDVSQMQSGVDVDRPRTRSALSDEENEQIATHLRELGYIE